MQFRDNNIEDIIEEVIFKTLNGDIRRLRPEEFDFETRDQGSKMMGQRSKKLVAPRIRIIYYRQRRCQIGNVRTLVTKTGILCASISSLREVKTDGIQQDVDTAVPLDHPLQHDLKDRFPAGPSVGSSVLALAKVSCQVGIPLLLVGSDRQQVRASQRACVSVSKRSRYKSSRVRKYPTGLDEIDSTELIKIIEDIWAQRDEICAKVT